MKFRWDERKNKINENKHQITFEIATFVFQDPFILTVLDKRYHYTEDRWQSVGIVNQTLIFVVHTIEEQENEEEEIIRIISARTAIYSETRRYYLHRKDGQAAQSTQTPQTRLN